MATTFNCSFIAGKLNTYYGDTTITEQDILDAIDSIGVNYTLPGWSISLIAPDNTVIWTGDFYYGQDGEIFTTSFGDDKSPVSETYLTLNAVATDPDDNTYVLSSGDFLAGSYAGYFTGPDLNLGELLTGNLPSNTDGFSGILTFINPDDTYTTIPGITNIISLTINGESVDISTQSSDDGGISLFGIDLAFEDGETYTFSLVADVPVPSVWYRFKAPSTETWDGVIGVDTNQNVKEIWLYQSNGFTYYDFLTSESIGEVKFNVQGTETEIIATQVPVTFNEFNSSGSFTAGIGFEGNAIGYANTVGFGSWGTLNSGTIPAIPSRYEGDLPPGSIVFSDVVTQEGNSCLISVPILMSLSVSYENYSNSFDLTGVNGNPTGTNIQSIGFTDGDEVSFSITWGELVETPVSRKLRVRGINQQN